ncbi:endonuclease [Saccharomonospora sp. CUA-673]|uniref:endonuclease/exonuclease/phosphatase family protein n=1 Tax=Saccharomonospora sp. CUA-673 TaxID=1904969 RepID=UPI00095E8E40|nr:endonuclease/exonuclease/phosphatase family protein [Saccharomonospora sp. CUA-673]OLT42359.1 endonuclease [Saccharomonospora sp. CUA-673]
MVTVGTWNLENLFRPGQDGGPDSDREYQAKLDSLAKTITSIAPDVLAVQEVGDPEALADLVGKLDGDWHTELAEPDGRGIRVGFCSRHALGDVEQVTDFPDQLQPVQTTDDGEPVQAMSRPALQASVDLDSGGVTFLTCHLKSKLLTFPGGRFNPRDEDERARYAVYALNRRAAEAATVRTHATALLDGNGQDRALIVLGDLNDTQHAATTSLLHGPPGSEIGTPGFDRADQGDGARLWNLAEHIPADQRHSRTYNGRAELIDHILVSHQLVERVTEVGTVDIGATSVGDQPRQRRNEPASDHRPVIATF